MQLQIYIVSLSKGCFSLIMKAAQGLILFLLGLVFQNGVLLQIKRDPGIL